MRWIVSLVSLWIVACAEGRVSPDLPLEPVPESSPSEPGTVDQARAETTADPAWVHGTLRMDPAVRGRAAFTVSLVGLEPDRTYVLSLNARDADSASSDVLGNLQIPGWPLGGFSPSLIGRLEGYWDFAEIQIDGQGRYLEHFELPLPAHPYRVKFLVKTNHDSGARPVLTSQPLLLEVRSALDVYVLTGMGTLAAIPIVFFVRGRCRRRVAAYPGSTEVAAPEPCAPSSAVLESGVACASTRVERARAEGVLLYQRNYAWIEIHGKRKSFRPRQALVFRILCELDPDCEGMPQDEIIKAWEEVFGAKRASPMRMRDIFRSCEHEPGDFIVRVPGPASVFRLRLEPTPPPLSCDFERECSGFDSLRDSC